MKLVTFFETKSKQGKIALSEDLKKKLEAVDVDIDDVFVNLFDQEFLTRERAVSDPKVYDKIRAEQLDAVDAIVKDYLPLLDDKDKNDLASEPKTFNKLKMLKDAFNRKIEKVKAENPNNDDKVKELQKINQEYVEKMKSMQSDWEGKEKELNSKFETEKKGMKLDWTLDKKVGEYTFADEFKEVKGTLVKTILDKVKGENVLILDDNGQIQVHEKTEAGVTKQKFNGNDPVTLDKLLEEPLKPFLKKNNGAGTGAAATQQNNGGGQQGRSTNPPITKDPANMTLQERIRAQMA